MIAEQRSQSKVNHVFAGITPVCVGGFGGKGLWLITRNIQWIIMAICPAGMEVRWGEVSNFKIEIVKIVFTSRNYQQGF